MGRRLLSRGNYGDTILNSSLPIAGNNRAALAANGFAFMADARRTPVTGRPPSCMLTRMGGSIFVSYRRGDASGVGGRLCDRLAGRFPEERVASGIDATGPGEDRAAGPARAAAADVVLAVIGADWFGAGAGTGLDDPHDRVRLEISAALAQGKIVLPVLVDAAAMPVAGDLPQDLRPLAGKGAVTLGHADFDADAARLCVVLDNILQETAPRRNAPESAEPEGGQAGPGDGRNGATAEGAEGAARTHPHRAAGWHRDDPIGEHDELREDGTFPEQKHHRARYRDLLLSPFERYSGARFFAGFLFVYLAILLFLYFSLVGAGI